jgi:nucleoside-diphosphate-sugar epimerase
VSSPRKRVLVLGATGGVGFAATEHFVADPDCDVVAVSRHHPNVDPRPGYVHARVDLRDREAVKGLMVDHGPITHVVYAALFEKEDLVSGWVDADQIDTNRLMLSNVLEALGAAGSPIRHISVLQGTKAYGYHLGPMRIPGKESQPRVGHDNFYWAQEDLLITSARRLGAFYTIFRPQFVFSASIGSAMSLIPAIGVYAALCRELGRPFSYTGGASYIAEAADSRLLAKAIHWAGDALGAANETFNITNGDVFEWRDIWPFFAEMLGVEPGPDEHRSLAEWLPQQEATWARIVDRHDLRPLTLRAILGKSHQFLDDAFAYTADGSPLESRSRPVLLSTIKLRQAGFTECIDTEHMFAHWFARLRQERVLP